MSKKLTKSRLPVFISRVCSTSYANRRDVTPQANNFQAKPSNAKPLNAKPLNANPLNAKPINAKPFNAKPLNAKPINAKPLNARSISVVSCRPTDRDATATNLQKPLDLDENRQGYSSTQSAQIRKSRSICSLPTDDTNSMENSAISKNKKPAGDKVKSNLELRKPPLILDKSKTPKAELGFGPNIKKTETLGSRTDLTKSMACFEIVSDQTDVLPEKNVALQDMDENQIQLLNELNKQKFTNADLIERLAAANENLDSSAMTGQKNTERVECLEVELKEARELIMNLKSRPDAIDQTDLLAQKNVALQDLQQSQIELVNELHKQKLINADLVKRLAVADENLESSATTGQQNTERVEYLEAELKEARDLIVNLQKQPDAMNRSIKKKERVISHLKAQLKNVEKHKDLLINQLNNMLKTKDQDHNELQTMYEEALSSIGELQAQIAEKERAIAEFSVLEESLLNQLDHSREEYNRLKEEMVCLQEEIKRDKKLLHARSEMISSLVLRGEDAEKTMDEMYSKIKKELDTKNVEFRTLFNTLTAKQIDLHRQERTIKLLEESNDRNMELNEIKEKHNVELLAEILQLKQTIRGYAKIIIGTSGQPLFEFVSNAELAIE